MRAIIAVAGYGSCDKCGAGQANTLFSVDPTAGPVRGRDRFIRLKAAEVDAALAELGSFLVEVLHLGARHRRVIRTGDKRLCLRR